MFVPIFSFLPSPPSFSTFFLSNKMMFAVADLSAATGGCMANNGQKISKVRYGNYFSGVAADKWGENDEKKVLKRMKKVEERLKESKMEQSNGEHRGRAKRLVEKLAKLLTAGDLSFLTADRKTLSSRDKAKKPSSVKKSLQLQQQQQHQSRNSSQSSLFEPMPTIEEETDTELMEQQQMASRSAEEDKQQEEAAEQQQRNNRVTMWETMCKTVRDGQKWEGDELRTKAQHFGTTQSKLQAVA